jgi:hypothetical protein
MDLFSQNTHSNMLPYEGEVIYLGSVFNRKEITSYYQNLLQQIPWQNDEDIIF